MNTPRIGKRDVLSRHVSRPQERSGAFSRSVASPYAILIVFPTIVLGLGLFLTLTAQRALRASNLEMAGDRMTDQATLVAAHLRGALGQADPMLDDLERVARRCSPSEPIVVMARALEHAMYGRPGVSFASVSFADGTFQGAYLDDDGVVRFQDSRVEGGSTLVRHFDFTAENELRPRRELRNDYDPRQRDFYRLAAAAQARVWTKPYLFFATNYTGVTRAAPVYVTAPSGERKLHAVVTIDFDVHELSSLLAQTELPEVRTLLFDQAGTLLAYPQGAERIAQMDHPAGRTLRQEDLHDPVLTSFFGALGAKRVSHDAPTPSAIDSDGVTYLASVARVSADPALDWCVAYLVPEAAFLGSLKAYSERGFFVGGVALALALAVSIGFARLIIRARREVAAARAEARRASQKARELGSYRLIECLGKGGMGEVWRAEHRLLAREAAIKLIRQDEGTLSAEAVERFRREAQSLASLRSRNTIELFDYGVAEDGTFFYVMELLDGLDWESLVTHFGPQPVGRVVTLLTQACRSLAEAHDAGLVHRDVKPANLFVCRVADEFDVVKVLDFGLVRSVAGDEEAPMSTRGAANAEAASHVSGEHPAGSHDSNPSAHLTRADNVMGTPDFIAPEQAIGGVIDGRADIYALGCVAYWLLTGQVLFQRVGVLQLLVAHIHEAPPDVRALSPRAVPPALAALIARCLAKSADDRPATARELQALLEAIEIPPEERWSGPQAREWWTEHRERHIASTSQTISLDADIAHASLARPG